MGAINGHNLISSSAAGTIEGSNPKRYSNSISYLLPKMNGFYGQASYAFGEKAKGNSNSLSSSMGVRLGYGNGPLNVALGYGTTKGGTAADTINYKTFNLGASYNFGMLTPMVSVCGALPIMHGQAFFVAASVPSAARSSLSHSLRCAG